MRSTPHDIGTNKITKTLDGKSVEFTKWTIDRETIPLGSVNDKKLDKVFLSLLEGNEQVSAMDPKYESTYLRYLPPAPYRQRVQANLHYLAGRSQQYLGKHYPGLVDWSFIEIKHEAIIDNDAKMAAVSRDYLDGKCIIAISNTGFEQPLLQDLKPEDAREVVTRAQDSLDATLFHEIL